MPEIVAHCGTMVDSKTRDPVETISNHIAGIRKISYRSNQNKTTTNPSAP